MAHGGSEIWNEQEGVQSREVPVAGIQGDQCAGGLGDGVSLKGGRPSGSLL